jgi:hypothetical protein
MGPIHECVWNFLLSRVKEYEFPILHTSFNAFIRACKEGGLNADIKI